LLFVDGDVARKEKEVLEDEIEMERFFVYSAIRKRKEVVEEKKKLEEGNPYFVLLTNTVL